MKKALVILIMLVMLITIGVFFVWRYQKKWVHNLKTTTGLLFENDTLYYSDFKFSIFPTTYAVQDLYYDSRDSATQILLTAERMYASVDAASFLGGLENIAVESFEVENGKLVMKSTKTEGLEGDDFHFEGIGAISVNRFSIRDFAFLVTTPKNGYEFYIEDFSTKLAMSQKDGNIALEAKPENTECRLQNLTLRDAWRHHDLACANLSYSRERGLEVVDFQIAPQYGRKRFDAFPQLEVRTELKTPFIKIPGFSWKQDSAFHVHLPVATLEATVLNIYQNMIRPFGPKPKKSPPSWFSNLDFVLQIDTVKWANTRIEYQEKHNDDSPLSKLHLTGDINAYHLGNHANRPEHMEIDGKLLIMDGCPLQGHIVFNYNDPTDPFRFKGQIGKTDFKVFNPAIEHSWGIFIKSGQCEKADFVFWGNNHHSEGTLKIAYTDLYIKRTEKNKFIHRATDWALNSLVLNSSSTYGKECKIGVERKKNRSVVAFWWLSIESGLREALVKKSIMATSNPKVMQKKHSIEEK